MNNVKLAPLEEKKKCDKAHQIHEGRHAAIDGDIQHIHIESTFPQMIFIAAIGNQAHVIASGHCSQVSEKKRLSGPNTRNNYADSFPG